MMTTYETEPQVDWRGVRAFVLITFGLSWALEVLLWLPGLGLHSPWFPAIAAAGMWTPAIATFVVTHWIRPIPNIRQATGLRLGAPGTRWGWVYLAAWLVPPALMLASLFFGALLGIYPLDLQFSGFRAVLAAQPGGAGTLAQLPLQTLVWLQLALLPLGAINIWATFGEEYGWRGYLLPQLLPLGQWRALLLSGAIWGVWHAPIIALGYNYPLHPYLGVGMMVIFCGLMGILFGWMRLATGSVWPSTIAHATLNGSSGLILLFSRAGASIDTAQASLLGWSGWLLLVVVLGLLVVTRLLPVRNSPDHVATAGLVTTVPTTSVVEPVHAPPVAGSWR